MAVLGRAGGRREGKNENTLQLPFIHSNLQFATNVSSESGHSIKHDVNNNFLPLSTDFRFSLA